MPLISKGRAERCARDCTRQMNVLCHPHLRTRTRTRTMLHVTHMAHTVPYPIANNAHTAHTAHNTLHALLHTSLTLLRAHTHCPYCRQKTSRTFRSVFATKGPLRSCRRRLQQRYQATKKCLRNGKGESS